MRRRSERRWLARWLMAVLVAASIGTVAVYGHQSADTSAPPPPDYEIPRYSEVEHGG